MVNRLNVLAVLTTALQRKEPVASTRFPAAQFHESWSRPAAVRVGRQSAIGLNRFSGLVQRPFSDIGITELNALKRSL